MRFLGYTCNTSPFESVAKAMRLLELSLLPACPKRSPSPPLRVCYQRRISTMAPRLKVCIHATSIINCTKVCRSPPRRNRGLSFVPLDFWSLSLHVNKIMGKKDKTLLTSANLKTSMCYKICTLVGERKRTMSQHSEVVDWIGLGSAGKLRGVCNKRQYRRIDHPFGRLPRLFVGSRGTILVRIQD